MSKDIAVIDSDNQIILRKVGQPAARALRMESVNQYV